MPSILNFRLAASGFAAFAVIAGTAAVNARGAVIITEVMSSSGTGGTPDWFEVVNTGPAALDITGWKMDDNSFSNSLAVALNGVTSLPVNTPVAFLEGASSDADAFKTFWGGAAASMNVGYYSGSGVGLSSTADGVTLFDAGGTEVPGVRVSFGAATAGVSFGYKNGSFGTLSAIGDGVSYTSANALANVGSPGVAVVPEPATLAAGTLIGAVARRRRRA